MSTRKPLEETEFDIWKLVKRSDNSTPYTLTLRYRSDAKKTEAAGKRLKCTIVSRRRRRRPDSGTESDSSDSALTSSADIFQENESYFKEDYDFDAEDPPEPTLYPHLVHKPGNHLQELYHKACKEYGVVRYTKFYKGLTTDKIIMRRQRLSSMDVKTCAIALMVMQVSCMSCCMRKPTIWFPTRTDTNRPVQPQKTESYLIHSLDLGENNIDALGASYIAQLLVENQFIKHLYLQDNNLQTQGAASLVDVVKQFDGLTTLDLSGNGLKESDAEILRPLFTDTINLKVLNLSHNQFREKGGKIIGEALGSNDTLEDLNLSWNHLRQHGAVKIAEAISNHPSLRVLNLSWNGFHSLGCNALSKALSKNTALTEIDIASNRIDDELLQKLITGLKKNSTLKILKIGQNPISPEAATDILLFIKNNDTTGLEKLDLTDQLVKSSFLDVLTEIRKTRPLEVICGRVKDHDDNPVGDDERSLLEEDPVLVLMEFAKMMGFRLIDLFAVLDKDDGRSLDHSEIKHGLKALNLPLSDMCIDLLIKNLDINLDGAIEFGELMSAYNQQRRKSSLMFDAGNKNLDVDETDVGRVRTKLHRLMKKRMTEKPEMKESIENMRRTLSKFGGDTRQDFLRKTLDSQTTEETHLEKT